MLISQSVPSLINGVSQQPPALRLNSQGEEQVNMLSSVVEGLGNRPGTRHVAKLLDSPLQGAFLHVINRDAQERYLTVIDPAVPSVRVFSAHTGAELTVNPVGSALDYIAGAQPGQLKAVTVADHTYILNTTRKIRKAPPEQRRPPEALVFVRAGGYARDYRIYIDGVEKAHYRTRDADDADHAFDLRTNNIANQLYTDLRTSLNVDTDPTWNVEIYGSVIHIYRSAPTDPDFDIRTDDGHGGNDMRGFKDRVQRFGDLPEQAAPGFTIEVVGDQTSSFDNYHVQYVSETGEWSSSGVWEETYKRGEAREFLNEDMPHLLVREADGTFTFREAEWDAREVGDEDSIPWPSFVDRTISDIFFYRNRLGFTTDENVVLSQAGEFYRFWPETATAVVDSDPVDLGVSHTRVSLLRHAVPFNRTLLLFSDQTQFVLEGGDILTPSSSSVGTTTEYEADPNVRPVGVGQFVYFPVTRGRYSSVREYFTDGYNETSEAYDVTAHCPRYIPANLSLMIASTSEDILVLLSPDTPMSLWVYRFHFAGEEKLQSSWSRWELTGEGRILTAAFLGSQLFLVVSRPEGTFIETMDIEVGRTDPGMSIHLHMDRKVTEASFLKAAYDPDKNRTRIVLPYDTWEDLWVVVREGDEEYPEGTVLAHYRGNASEVMVEGDHSERKLYIGTKFRATYTFSPFHLKENTGDGATSPIGEGRLQLRYLAVNFAQTGYFEVVVKPKGRAASKRTYTGRTLGLSSTTMGEINVADGRFKVPLLARNTEVTIELTTDSFLPCRFLGAEWEGRFTMRSRRM